MCFKITTAIFFWLVAAFGKTQNNLFILSSSSPEEAEKDRWKLEANKNLYVIKLFLVLPKTAKNLKNIY